MTNLAVAVLTGHAREQLARRNIDEADVRDVLAAPDHALSRADAWVLCGPDKASLRFGVRLGFRDQLVALEWLLDAVGHRPREPLKPAYTTKWLAGNLSQFALKALGRS